VSEEHSPADQKCAAGGLRPLLAKIASGLTHHPSITISCYIFIVTMCVSTSTNDSS